MDSMDEPNTREKEVSKMLLVSAGVKMTTGVQQVFNIPVPVPYGTGTDKA
jgi:hypothetical protein